MLLYSSLLSEGAHARAALRVELAQAVTGKPFLAAVEITTDPHWHVYWRNPGDSGIPTKVQWRVPKGWKVEPLEFPIPRKFAPGGVANYGYEGKTYLLARVTPTTTGNYALSAQVDWLVCSDACVPGSASPSARLRVGSTRKPSPYASTLRKAQSALPAKAGPGWSFQAWQTPKTVVLSATPPASAGLPRGMPTFFPSGSGVIDHGKPTLATLKKGKLVLKMSASPFPEGRTRLAGILVAPPGTTWPGGRRALMVDARLEKGDPH